jgi:hypothetical protein
MRLHYFLTDLFEIIHELLILGGELLSLLSYIH